MASCSTGRIPLPLSRPHFGPEGASGFQDLIFSLRTDTVDSAAIGRELCELRDQIGLPSDFDSLTNAAKCSVVSDAGLAPETITRFLRLAAKRNTARLFGGSLRAAASGMQPYLNFCVFIGRPAFPVQTENILLRSGLFRPGRAFAQYIAHVMKAAILIGYPTDCLSPSARSVARGLKNSHGLSFRFQNFMFASDLLHLLQSVSLTTEFGQAAFLSFLFLLRVPSGTLQLRFAADSDALADFSPQKFNDIAGVRTISGSPLLSAKFSWRVNIRSVCILRRPCLRDEREELERMLSPSHMIWPRILAGGACRGLLFPSLTRSNFNRFLKRNKTASCFPDGGRFSPHFFRRGGGGPQELLLAGHPENRIKAAGCWISMGFRISIDTQMTGALKITRLIASSIKSASEDDAGIPIRTPRVDALRKKLRIFPGREFRQ